MRLHRFKSRQRVTIRLGTALVALFCIGAWMTAQAVQRELRDGIDDQLRRDSVETAAVVEMLGSDAARDVASRFDDAAFGFGFEGSEWAMVLRFPTGEDIVIGPVVDDPDAVPDVLDIPIAELRGRAGEPFSVDDVGGRDDAYRVVALALDDGQVIVVARSLDGVHAVLAILHKTFLIATVISVLALATLVWMISRQVLKPLEDMVETAHAIGAGTLDTRVQIDCSAPDVERLSDAMNTMLARLQTAFDRQDRTEARLRQFVSNASHELRTPLAAILGHAELYHEGMAAGPEQVEAAMRHITAEGTRMQSLVEDLLLLARLDEGRPLVRDAVDLAGVVEDAVGAAEARDGGHRFVIDVEPVQVIGDVLALRQILDNLLSNVIAHTPAGTTARIELRPVVSADDAPPARIVVSDDGPGMTAEAATHVFERFVRAESSRARPDGSLGGSGLGLSIVDELVRAHGGTVTVRSAPGDGATFTVELPAEPDADGPDAYDRGRDARSR